jgi:hypothetical protein
MMEELDKLWVDDQRHPPDSTWMRARTFLEAVDAVINRTEPWEVISMDHDLSDHQPTGYDFVRWMVYYQQEKLPKVFRLHTANPVGYGAMESVIKHSGVYNERELYGTGYIKEVKDSPTSDR